MPSTNDTLLRNLNLEGYKPVDAPPVSPKAPPPVHSEPGRNTMIRCPLPPLWEASPDSLRQFYVNDKVPQIRLLSPQPLPLASLGSSSTSSSGGSSSGSAITGTVLSSSGGGSSSGTVAQTATPFAIRTQVLGAGAQFVGSVQIAKGFQLLSVAANGACRIQLYGTAQAQAQDLGRALDEPPAAGTTQNIITDLALDTPPYSWSFQNRIAANADSPQTSTVYVTISNIGLAAVAYTVTFQCVPLES